MPGAGKVAENEAVVNLYSNRKDGNPGHKASSGTATTSFSGSIVSQSGVESQAESGKIKLPTLSASAGGANLALEQVRTGESATNDDSISYPCPKSQAESGKTLRQAGRPIRRQGCYHCL